MGFEPQPLRGKAKLNESSMSLPNLERGRQISGRAAADRHHVFARFGFPFLSSTPNCQISLSYMQGEMLRFTCLKMYVGESFQLFHRRSHACRGLVNIDLRDFIAITVAGVLQIEGDNDVITAPGSWRSNYQAIVFESCVA